MAAQHVSDRGNWVVIEIGGDLDLASAPALRQEVLGLVAGGRRFIVIDLVLTGFIDSMGLGTLVAVRKRARVHGGEVEVVCPEPRLRRVFAVAGLDAAFVLHDTVAQAMGTERGPSTSVLRDE